MPGPALGTEKFSLKIDVRDQTLWKYKTCSRINDISLYLMKVDFHNNTKEGAEYAQNYIK